MRVLGRIRLSRVTDESTSVERQTEAIETWSAQHGHTIVGWATDLDFSRSVKPFDAPKFGQWLNDPEKVDQWDIVVAQRLDRFGAGLKLSPLYQWCYENDKELICTTQPFNLRTPEGRIVATVLAEIAQGEWEATQERILNTRTFLRNEGRWPGGTAKYGYWPVKTGKGWKLVHDPVAAPIVRRIVNEYLDGTNRETIAERLTKDGIDAPMTHIRKRKMEAARAAGEEYTGTLPTDIPWQSTTIAKLLDSWSIVGYVTHDDDWRGEEPKKGRKQRIKRDDKGEPVTFGPPIILPAQFQLIQEETARRKAGKVQRERNTGQLLDVAKCWECKGNLHHRTHHKKPTKDGNPGKVYRYYYCPNKHTKHIRAERLEMYVEGSFLGLLEHSPRMRRVYVPAEDHTAELEAAVSAYEELTATAEEARSQKAKDVLRGQLRALDGRIAELEALPAKPARTELREVGSTYGEEWKRLDEIGRRNLLRESGILWTAHKAEGEGLEMGIIIPSDIRNRLNIAPSVGGTRTALDNFEIAAQAIMNEDE